MGVLCEHIPTSTFSICDCNSYHSVPLDIVGPGVDVAD